MKAILKLMVLIFMVSFLACNNFLRQKPITIKGQLIDEIGKYPIGGVLIQVNETENVVLSNKDGYFTSFDGKKGDNELVFLWNGKEISTLLIELKANKTYDFGQIKINAPMIRPLLLG